MPRTKVDSPGAAITLPTAPPLAETILLVDDDNYCRALVRATLGKGYRLLEAANGREALALARSKRPGLVLLDVQMPRLDGFTVCRALKADPHTSQALVIMLTARDSPEDQQLGAQSGADGYLVKPFSPFALIGAVERALSDAHGFLLEPSTARAYDAGGGQVEAAQTLAYAGELRRLYEQAKAQATRFRLLIELGDQLTAAEDLDALLQLALERASAFAGFDTGSVLLNAALEGALEVRAVVGPHSAPLGAIAQDVDRSPAVRALATRHPVVTHGRLEGSPAAPVASSVCFPLVTTAGNARGVLALKSLHRRVELDPQDLDALQLLATQLANCIESVELGERLQELVQRLLTAQEDERRRVAYDVHDALAQVAAGTYQHLQAYARRHRPRSPQGRAELGQTLDLARLTVQEARRIIADLRPTALDDFGLATALGLEIERARTPRLEVHLRDRLGPDRLPAAVETALFRVAREALTNVEKHARATRVEVLLERRGHLACLEVRDDGAGFSPTAVGGPPRPGERIGLASMRERIATLGGQCSIESEPGAGTAVRVAVPVPPHDSAGSGGDP